MKLHLAVLMLAVSWGPEQGLRGAEPAPEQTEFFEKQVRPLLVEQCFGCHSTGKKQKAHLVLDSRQAILKGGDSGPAIVPGRPDESRLIRAIRYQDDDLRMPPRGKLADSQIATLTTWVRQGAPWPGSGGVSPPDATSGKIDIQARSKHWAWQPLRAVSPPAVRNADWPIRAVDCFLLARLESAGLTPAPPADKRTLLRRITYDLIGLPPTPRELDDFLADDRPDAYARVVERLLASPHYGERWGRHWLDLVRYAETYGHEFDFEIPEAHRYRDYEIRALNADVPYDQLVREHLAGDLLPQPRRNPQDGTNESILGSCFWYLGESTHSPVDICVDEANRIDNQIDVFAKTFLGLTVACARCHDHKFDAITTRDYYALVGYLQSSRLQKAFLDDPERTSRRLEQLRQLRQEVDRAAIACTCSALQSQLGRLPDKPAVTPSISASVGQAVRFADAYVHPFADWSATGPAFTAGRTGEPVPIIDSDKALPIRYLMPPRSACSNRVADCLEGVFRSPTFRLTKKKIWYHVAGRNGQIRLILDGLQLIQDPIYGGLKMTVNHPDHPEWHMQDVSMWLGQRAYIEFVDDGAGFLACDQVVFADDGPPPAISQTRFDPGDATASARSSSVRTLLEHWRNGTLSQQPDVPGCLEHLNRLLQSMPSAISPADDRLVPALTKLRAAEASWPRAQRGLAMADGTGWNEHVYIRGNPRNLGEEVPRRFLEVLAGPHQPAPTQGSGRLELAERVLDRSNPLVPRVLVNRVWQHHFGEGIVRSLDNLGALGERPTHPELLDYLALEFIRGGWSLKNLHRELVLSRAYQMASHTDDLSAEQRDPRNELLHRMPRRRLEAEAIRDAMLAVSGDLRRQFFGVSVPTHLTPHMVGRGRPGVSGPLDGNGRRSIYLAVRRNFLTPFFLAFDYPIPFTTIGRRTTSNVPAQALTLLNNPFVLTQAQRWAQQLLATGTLSAEQRIRSMYIAALGRPPEVGEMAAALEFLDQPGSDELSRWTDLCHVLFNVKEFVFVD